MWIDLTKPLDDSAEIYAEDSYRDPEFAAELWTDHALRGYEVWRLEMGTQTGTHIDAPRHFDPEGETIDALGPKECVGHYVLVTVEELLASAGAAAEGNRVEGSRVSEILPNEPGRNSACEWLRLETGHFSSDGLVTAVVLDARVSDQLTLTPRESAKPPCPAMLSPEAVEAIATAPCRLIVVIGEVSAQHPTPFYFPRRLAACGKFLVEDTREDIAELPREGHIIALPLRLTGLSGSPARVLIRGNEQRGERCG